MNVVDRVVQAAACWRWTLLVALALGFGTSLVIGAHAASPAVYLTGCLDPKADRLYSVALGTEPAARCKPGDAPVTLSNGDITEVNTPLGSGLKGGTASGAMTLEVDTTAVQKRVTGACSEGNSIRVIHEDGSVACEADTDTTHTAGPGLQLSAAQFSVDFAGTGASTTASRSDHNHDASYWDLGGNFGTDPAVNFLGTIDNQALEARVNNQRALRIQPTASSPNVVLGSSRNTVAAGVQGATIGGGGSTRPEELHQVTGDFATVSGGLSNSAYGEDSSVGGGRFNAANAHSSTVGGGHDNTASGQASAVGGGSTNIASGQNSVVAGGATNQATALYVTVAGGNGNIATDALSTIGGGSQNTASGLASTVAGGHDNTASGPNATVSGGEFNSAGGANSTVAGGNQNSAAGHGSFAAGHRAKAIHQGAFVWGDSSDTDVASSRDNQLVARTSGGATFYSDAGLSSGVQLHPGSGSWSSLSDRRLKVGFSLVDGRQALERLATVPVGTWSYITQDSSVQHIGPTAQDFFAAFQLGEDERYINTVDAQGVALAAIQGLYEVVQEKESKIAALEASNAGHEAEIVSLKQQNASLYARLSAIERRIEVGDAQGRAGSDLPGIWQALGLGMLTLTGVAVGSRLRRSQ